MSPRSLTATQTAQEVSSTDDMSLKLSIHHRSRHSLHSHYPHWTTISQTLAGRRRRRLSAGREEESQAETGSGTVSWSAACTSASRARSLVISIAGEETVYIHPFHYLKLQARLKTFPRSPSILTCLERIGAFLLATRRNKVSVEAQVKLKTMSDSLDPSSVSPATADVTEHNFKIFENCTVRELIDGKKMRFSSAFKTKALRFCASRQISAHCLPQSTKEMMEFLTSVGWNSQDPAVAGVLATKLLNFLRNNINEDKLRPGLTETALIPGKACGDWKSAWKVFTLEWTRSDSTFVIGVSKAVPDGEERGDLIMDDAMLWQDRKTELVRAWISPTALARAVAEYVACSGAVDAGIPEPRGSKLGQQDESVHHESGVPEVLDQATPLRYAAPVQAIDVALSKPSIRRQKAVAFDMSAPKSVMGSSSTDKTIADSVGRSEEPAFPDTLGYGTISQQGIKNVAGGNKTAYPQQEDAMPKQIMDHETAFLRPREVPEKRDAGIPLTSLASERASGQGKMWHDLQHEAEVRLRQEHELDVEARIRAALQKQKDSHDKELQIMREEMVRQLEKSAIRHVGDHHEPEMRELYPKPSRNSVAGGLDTVPDWNTPEGSYHRLPYTLAFDRDVDDHLTPFIRDISLPASTTSDEAFPYAKHNTSIFRGRQPTEMSTTGGYSSLQGHHIVDELSPSIRAAMVKQFGAGAGARTRMREI
nr:hypothetical protein CFP56_69053 [Quercus suber]